MQADLLDAQASVNWAVTQTETFDQRIKAWTRVYFEVRIEETPAPAAQNRVIALLKEPLPRAFNVEFGVCINAIRTSLDILATALAERHHIKGESKIYFPVVRSAHEWTAGKFKGHHLVNGLPDVERRKIEAFQPYNGVNNKSLWELHELDIKRKHRRLIGLTNRPVGFAMQGVQTGFTANPALTDWTLSPNQETVIGFIDKGRQNEEIKFFPAVACAEPGITFRNPVQGTILYFAEVANKIIAAFS